MNVNQKANLESVNSNEDRLKQLNRSLERKIKHKEQEIENVRKNYDDRVSTAKLDGEKRFLTTLDKNQEQLLNESLQYEEKISSYKDRLADTQKKIDQEKKVLDNNHAARMIELKTNHNEIIETNTADLLESQKNIERNNQETFSNLAHKHNTTKSQMESDLNRNIQSMTTDHFSRMAEVKQKQKIEERYQIAKTDNELSSLKKDLSEGLDQEIAKTTRLTNEQKRVHQDKMIFQDKYQQDLLLQKDNDFKVRYQNLVDNHNEAIKTISEKLQNDLKKVVEGKSKNLEITQKQGEDSFYSVSLIRPTVTETEKEMLIAIPVSEYEKDNVLLSAQGRNIKITLSRKYADSLKEVDGSTNKTTRSELYSKEFNTKDLLSPNNITQNYQDGLLTFKVLKA